jgi:hypothetical protein
MSHILATLRNVQLEVIGQILRNDAPEHAKEGLYLEHLWQNIDDENEVLFLFRADNLMHVKEYIEGLHTQALKENPEANLPRMIYLK